ncbi:MAG TPA: tetratricopeptide repeat protein [Planctomycetota bacterium]|nr:tetratricopeptide repeat protein [Planctomycetota bacterium]
MRSDNAVDPRTYYFCQDPEGNAAWQRAQKALADRDDAGALPDLRLCAERCANLVRAHLAYQDAARRLGGEAQRAMQDFYLKAPDGPSPVTAYLKARLAETSYAQSHALADILKRDPSFAWAHLSQARINRRQGRLLQAVDMFAAAIVNDPDLHEARLERAQVLAELGRDDEASLDYRAYVKAVPTDLDATRAYITLLLYRLGHIDEAWGLLLRLEQQGDHSLALRMDKGAAQWRANNPRAAVQTYLDILAEAPDTARAALNLGLLYYEVLPHNDDERRLYWPRARAALRWFLRTTVPSDGHEQFERTLAVPYRLQIIADLLGPDPGGPLALDDLRLPPG